MKKYNINPTEKEFPWGKMLVISLGERGRGRFEALVPFHAPENAEYLDIGQTKSGKPKIIKGHGPDDKWLTVLSGGGIYTRGTYGTVYCLPQDKDRIQVVASGYGAYGMAGRIGLWNEFLAIVPDNTFIKIRPAGGSHKIERYWLFFSVDKVYRVEKNEMDLFCEQMDLERPPEEFDNLVDLDKIKD